MNLTTAPEQDPLLVQLAVASPRDLEELKPRPSEQMPIRLTFCEQIYHLRGSRKGGVSS